MIDGKVRYPDLCEDTMLLASDPKGLMFVLHSWDFQQEKLPGSCQGSVPPGCLHLKLFSIGSIAHHGLLIRHYEGYLSVKGFRTTGHPIY